MARRGALLLVLAIVVGTGVLLALFSSPLSGEDLAKRGETLYRQLPCAVCHEMEGAETGIDIPPTLRFEGSRAEKPWILKYLLEPGRIRFASDGVRAELQMPNFQLTVEDASALAEYLSTCTDPAVIPESGIDWSALSSAAEIREGRLLFRQYQCQGCHRTDGEGAEVGPHLDGVGSRRRPDYMYALVLNPDRVVPGTPMKNSDLWEEEARAIVQFLRTLR